MTADRRRLDVDRRQEGLPDPRARGARPAPRLPRLGQHVAEAAGRARRHGALLRAVQRQRAPRHLPHRRGGHRRPRGRPGQGRPLHRRAALPRGRVHQERHRGAQPRGQGVGPGQPAGRRRRRAHRARAPRQHRPVAPARTTSWASSCAGSRSGPTATSTSPTSTGWSTAPRSSPFAAMSNVLGTLLPGRPAGATPPTTPAPSRWSTPASTCPTWPPTCRPGAPTSPPSPATRCAAPPASACSGAPSEILEATPAVPHRRRDDPQRHQGGVHAQRAARGSSRPARRRSPRPSASAPPSTTSRASAWRPCASTRSSLTAYALRTLTERFGDDLTIHGPSEPAARGGVLSLHLRRPAPPRPHAGVRRARRVRAGRATTAPSR